MDFEKLKREANDVFDVTTEAGIGIVSSMVFEGLLGSVLPGVTSVMFAYKQKRHKRMIIKFMEELKNRQCELEEKLKKCLKNKQKNLLQIFLAL